MRNLLLTDKFGKMFSIRREVSFGIINIKREIIKHLKSKSDLRWKKVF